MRYCKINGRNYYEKNNELNRIEKHIGCIFGLGQTDGNNRYCLR
jgi:hypothetical protein